MSMLQVSGLCAGYGRNHVLRDVSFTTEQGQMTGILGANGSGKTTLLKAICGILPHTGSCILDGVSLEGLSPRKLGALCGYIPQRSGISIDISLLDVVLMGFNPHLGLLEHPDRTMKQRAREMLIRVGLGGREEENYLKLSEGQKQLCILARTLVSDCRLLLFDEPESALDFAHRSRMLKLLMERIDSHPCTALVTLHDPMLALNCCHRLLLLKDGVVADSLMPRKDPDDKLAKALSEIYGPVSVTRIRGKDGREHLVMLGC